MTAAIAGLIGMGLGLPSVGYVISPALKRRAKQWVDVGAVADLSVGEPKDLEHVMTVQDGYLESRAIRSVWAVKQADGQVTVYSPLCPHLGCGYRWDEAAKEFKCPCHGSVFSITGQVLAGPAPRPLDTLPAKVEQGHLLVMYEQFKAGSPTKIEI